MPASPLKVFEYELYKLLPEDRVKLIDSKLEHLVKLKSNGGRHHLNDYYIQELNKMKKNMHIYSHRSPIAHLFESLMSNRDKSVKIYMYTFY